ncbi:MAG TPA: hypothetical protein VFW29_09925 [Solirubrobacteraceae bacterium]|nr:hypothetical protein [Solirubrobacteraceae bacterium]
MATHRRATRSFQIGVSHALAIAGAAALVAIAVIHLIDGPMSLEDPFYIGALELSLAAACVPLAILLVMRPVREVWGISAATVGLALVLYTLSRTTGLPGATDGIGNWGEPLAIANVVAEGAFLLLACAVLAIGRYEAGSPARRLWANRPNGAAHAA